MVLAERRTRILIITAEVGIAKSKVLKILHKDSGINKVSARWIPNKNCVGNKCEENLRALAEVQVMKSTHRESTQWVNKGCQPPKKEKRRIYLEADGDGILGRGRNLAG